MTRVADVTGLDRVGVPNFTTVRPREAVPGISYYNGKGLTASAAKAGALMEAVERHCAERCDLPVIRGTRDEIGEYGAAVDPRQLVAPLARAYDQRTTLEWVEGYDLMSDQPMFVPLDAVVCPYTPADPAARVYYSHTNGLASGNTIEEAICHAICEVVERDGLSIADTVDKLAPAVGQICAGGENPRNRKFAPATLGRRVALETLPPIARGVVTKMEQAGLRVSLRDISAAVGVATLECTCIEEGAGVGHVAHGGCGSHPDARVAVSRALTEAAQSRLAHIQGGREDLVDIISEPLPSHPKEAVERGDFYSFATVPTVENANIDDDIRYLLDRLADAKFEHVVVVELTRAELGVPVVRVVIPKAETWTLFCHHGASAKLGERANQALSDAVGDWFSSGKRSKSPEAFQPIRTSVR
ncbi:MAG: YcaO-like family protein [Solirubrobacterales bacterium]|nr:YcaO-like family protein [Solirubrobacterales bacterium]MBV9164623.1 YcaO-like family protein [Solirubrobacterales bacterium]MBV9534973.1 YcaO-like family protein [Solirubrobacterales bacterium]